jgi:5-methylcytosine-specific restriction enzyme subunit McrC
MMAYARLYETERLMLLYPHHAGLDRQGALARHRINGAGADDRLTIASIDVAADPLATNSSLKALALAEVLVAA